MPAKPMLLSAVCAALLASSPAVCQMPGPGGPAQRARPPVIADWARPSRPAWVAAVAAGRLALSDEKSCDEKKRQLEQQISSLQHICPACATGVAPGVAMPAGAAVARTVTDSCLARDASAIDSFRAQEAKCAALPTGMRDDDCIVVSKRLYRYLRSGQGGP